MLHKKGKRDPDNSTRARVKKEMAKPRMAKSARIAQRNLKKGLTLRLPSQLPKSGVKFIVFLQIGPKIDICS
jgi:hypothetical protein